MKRYDSNWNFIEKTKLVNKTECNSLLLLRCHKRESEEVKIMRWMEK